MPFHSLSKIIGPPNSSAMVARQNGDRVAASGKRRMRMNDAFQIGPLASDIQVTGDWLYRMKA